MASVTLIAPVGVHPVIAASGIAYTPDANRYITITLPSSDVLSLMEQGCVPVANVSNAVQAGSDGAAGLVTIFPTTASKGKVTVDTADNSGNTTTNIHVNAQAGARTFTVPDPGASARFLMQTAAGVIPVMDASGDVGATLVIAAQAAARDYTMPDMGGDASFVLTRQVLASNGMGPTQLKLLDGKNADGTGLSATPAAGNFTPSVTFGTSEALVGEDANNNTKTDTVWYEYVLPPNYISGEDITVRVHALYTTAGTVGTHTLAVLAHASSANGAQGANLVATSAATLTTSDAAYDFVITGTSLGAGLHIVIGIRTAIQETAAGGAIYSSINSVTLL